jgi:hypothetical protein
MSWQYDASFRDVCHVLEGDVFWDSLTFVLSEFIIV